MLKKKLFETAPSSGQALSELIVALPIAFILLAAPLTLRKQFSKRLVSDAELMDSLLDRMLETSRVTSAAEEFRCRPQVLQISTLQRTKSPLRSWPIEVDRQRAITLATARMGCLAEAQTRMPPKAAVALWGASVAVGNEASARGMTQILCPRIKESGERLRTSIIATQLGKRAREHALLVNYLHSFDSRCPKGVKSGRLLDRLIRPILDP